MAAGCSLGEAAEVRLWAAAPASTHDTMNMTHDNITMTHDTVTKKPEDEQEKGQSERLEQLVLRLADSWQV